uniref:NADH dehydrogenase subunit 5 n=1 Tax=Alviniconcha marisindica TaxID=1491186 RepID=UPI00255201E2|nr:NADH dehydrogenase subunit 5 [Alviniconcha marisindica]WGL39492.1 NADH dehydrogenase subunit 5 [Alviniconcha marisindica]WJK73060.1 NADH dehydrogenase subunit 5 [Alviniconcha marisindica]
MFLKMKSSSISSMFLLLYTVCLLPFTCYFVMNEISLLVEWTIISLSSCTMTFTLIFDGVSLSFSNVVCLISGCVMLFSSSYMSHDPFLKRFIWLVMLFVLSMNMLVFIPSLPALLLGWDGLGIVSFILVVYYQNMKSLAAGMLTILANRIGDVMILVSIGILVLQGHWYVTLMWDFHLTFVVAVAIMMAGLTKSAQIPFSAWLPAAMAAPTPVSALVHSSTLVTAGIFLIIRFFPFLSTCDFFKPLLLFISVLTLLMAGIAANYENDLKKVIALSTLSQLGVMMMSLGLGMVSLSLFHLYTHALFKALLFLCAGTIIHNSLNNQDLRYMGMVFHQAPLTITCMNIANLSLCGAPFLSGFYSKDLILETSLASPTSGLMIFFIFLATGMTAAYSLRLSLCSLWGTLKATPLYSWAEKDPYINWSTTILSLAAIFSGAFLQTVFLDFNPNSFILPHAHKFLTMFVLLLGLIAAASLWDTDFMQKKMDKMKFFFSTMWFLAPLSSQPLTKFSMLLGTNLMKSVDQGWLEILGGQGTFYLVSMVSKQNSKIQIKSFNFFIFLSLFSLVFILSANFYM